MNHSNLPKYPHSKYLEAEITQIIETFANNGQLLICGNGGSAADAQHIVAELINSLTHLKNTFPLDIS